MQEEVLKLVLLALEDGSALSRKVRIFQKECFSHLILLGRRRGLLDNRSTYKLGGSLPSYWERAPDTNLCNRTYL